MKLEDLAFSLYDFRTAEIKINMLDLRYGAISAMEIERAKLPKKFRTASNTVFHDFSIKALVQMPHKETASRLISPMAELKFVVTTAYNIHSKALKVIAVGSKDFNLKYRNDLLISQTRFKLKKVVFKALSDLEIEDYQDKEIIKAGEIFEIPKKDLESSVWRNVEYPSFAMPPISFIWGLEKFGLIHQIHDHIQSQSASFKPTNQKDYFDELADLTLIEPDLNSENYAICSNEQKRVDNHNCLFDLNKKVGNARNDAKCFYTAPNCFGSPFNSIHSSSLHLSQSNKQHKLIVDMGIGHSIPVSQDYIDYGFEVVGSQNLPLIIKLNDDYSFYNVLLTDDKKAFKKTENQSPEIRIFTNTKQQDCSFEFDRKYHYEKNQGFDFSLMDGRFEKNGIPFEVVPLTSTANKTYKGLQLAMWSKPVEETFNLYAVLGCENDSYYPLNPYIYFAKKKDTVFDIIENELLEQLPFIKTDFDNGLFYIQEAYCTVDKLINRV